jgi:hypothetical protein
MFRLYTALLVFFWVVTTQPFYDMGEVCINETIVFYVDMQQRMEQLFSIVSFFQKPLRAFLQVIRIVNTI